MRDLRLVAALTLVAAASAALPPGYEEELFCPKETCLAPRKMPSGFTGPRTAFHQCVNMATGHAIGSPRPHGSKMPSGHKDQLLKDGYHVKICPKSMVIKPDPKHGKDEHILREHEHKMMKEQQERRESGNENPVDGEPEHMRAARGYESRTRDSFSDKAEMLKKRTATKQHRPKHEAELSRAEHEKQHAERMEDLKNKHPEHYERMMRRKKELEDEGEEILRSRIEEKKAARKAGQGASKTEDMHIMRRPQGKQDDRLAATM